MAVAVSGCGGGPWQSEEIAKEWLKLAVVGFFVRRVSLFVFIRLSNEYSLRKKVSVCLQPPPKNELCIV